MYNVYYYVLYIYGNMGVYEHGFDHSKLIDNNNYCEFHFILSFYCEYYFIKYYILIYSI